MKQVRTSFGVALLAGAAVALTPFASQAKTHKVEPGQSIQAAVDLAEPGDTVMVYPGTYTEPAVSGPAVHVTKALRMKAKISGKDRKAGVKVIIQAGPGQTHGVLVEPAVEGGEHIEEFRIKGFTIRDFPNNGIYLRYVDEFRIENNETANNEENGIFPTLSANGLVKRNVSYGSDDSALWVEASTNVRVVENELYGSPTGLEVTVSRDVFMSKNDIHDNTTGVGLYHPNSASLPLPDGMVPGNWILEDNHIYNNNAPNTAPPGSQAAALPPGGGILVLGADQIQAYDNLVENNDFYGLSVIDYCTAVEGGDNDCDLNPPVYDPFPDQNIFGENTFNTNGTNPDPMHPLADYAADFTYIVVDSSSHINRFCENEPNTLTTAVAFTDYIEGACP